LSLILNLKNLLSPAAHSIVNYAFTEMVNNVIEHSDSENCLISANLDAYSFSFTVRDFGVGIFSRIAQYFELNNEEAGMQELIKGKRTSMPKQHTGEGVFFTSKAGDVLKIRSHHIQIIFDTRKDDIITGKKRTIQGTEIVFSIARQSKRNLQKIFEEYAPEEQDYIFSRTKILIKLFQEQYISRSEARRVVMGVTSFKEIVLDFKGVDSIGQGFADEIFRVFNSKYPEIRIITKNTNSVLDRMIAHVKVDKKK